MSEKTKDTPTVKVEVTTTPTPATGPARDAKNAREARLKIETEKSAANEKLEKAGLVPGVTPITGYEHERAQLGADQPATERKPE